MANRELKTKIKLRYDLLANWTAKNPELLAGEIAIVAIPVDVSEMQINGSEPPQILFKVGPGNFNNLPYASAKAADVHGWAKAASKPTYTAAEVGLGNVLNVASYAKTETYSKEEVNDKITEIQNALEKDTNTQYQIVADGDNGFKLQAKEINGTWADVEGSSFKVDFTAINAVLAGKADASALDNYYTKDQADGKFLTSHQDISGKADKSYVDEELGKKVDSSTYNTKVAEIDGRLDAIDGEEGLIADIQDSIGLINGDIEDINEELTLKAVKSEVETALAGKVDNSKLGDYYTKTEVDGQVGGLDSRITANANAIEALTNGASTEEIDSVMELVEYVNEHGTEVQGMKDSIKANADAIDALEGRADAVEGDISTLKEETIPGLSSRIQDYEDNKDKFALKTELFSGSYNDLTDKPDLAVYETVANVNTVRADVKSIKDDYLTSADKTELSGAINTEKGRIDTLVNTTIPTLATKAEVKDAIDNSHTHSNKAILDATTASFTTELKTKYDGYEGSISSVAGNVTSVENRVKAIEDDTTILKSTDTFIWDCGGAE